MNAPRPLAYLTMFTAAILWGATFSLQKMVMHSPQAHPLGVTLWQATIATVVGFGLAAAIGHRPRFDRQQLRFFVMLGLLGTAVPNTIFYAVAEHLPAGILAISVTTVPLLTYLAAMLCRVENFEHVRALGLVFGFVAILLVLLPEASLPERGQALWLLPALFSALCYAAEAMLATFARPPNTHSLVLIAGAMLMTAIILAPLVWITDTGYTIDLPLDGAEVSLIVMAIISMLAYAMYLFIVNVAGAVFASQIGYLVTLTGVGFGMLIFGERHSAWVWAAIVILFIGIALVQPRKGPGARMAADSTVA